MSDLGVLWASALGLSEPESLGAIGRAAARAAIIYIATLAIIRLGKKRFLGRGSPFDVIVAFVVGSVAGRAILGEAPLLPALAAVAVLMALHWFFSWASMRWHWAGLIVKGHDRILVRDGAVDADAMRIEHLSNRDLEEGLREAGLTNLANVESARLERDGRMSVILKKRP